MKKITYLLGILFMFAAIVSCNKEMTDDSELDMLKKAKVGATAGKVESLPVSSGSIRPYIIPGANNGGNRTCAEVATTWELVLNPFYCGDKIDYNAGVFAGTFPSGLDVTVTDGKYVSFEMDDCIQFGDRFYKVGAVIVKGSNAANIYYYPGGTIGDSGLASPINASGNPAGLSNLTFCFVECEQPELVIAFKTQTTCGPAWTVVEGFTAKTVDYYNFITGYNGKIYLGGDLTKPFGNINVSDSDADGKLEVSIDNRDSFGTGCNLMYESWLFVGTLEDYLACVTPYQFNYSKVVSSSYPSPLVYDLNF